MINPEVYAKEMALLQGWFGRDLSELVSAALYKSLSKRLETDEFCLACRLIFEQEKPSPYNFPSVQGFVEMARGTAEELASQEWASITNFSGGHDPQLSEVGQIALKRIGGRTLVGQAEASQIPWLKKEFIRQYLSITSEAKRKAAIAALKPQKGRRGLHAVK